MQPTRVEVFSLHPHADPPEFDLKDILRALEALAKGCVWWLSGLESVGGAVCESGGRASDTAGDKGLWMPWAELEAFAQDTRQTIEGRLVAFPADLDRRAVTAEERGLGAFPTSRASLAIVAIDGCYFDVYAKTPDVGASLRQHFREVRVEDPSNYFVAAPLDG